MIKLLTCHSSHLLCRLAHQSRQDGTRRTAAACAGPTWFPSHVTSRRYKEKQQIFKKLSLNLCHKIQNCLKLPYSTYFKNWDIMALKKIAKYTPYYLENLTFRKRWKILKNICKTFGSLFGWFDSDFKGKKWKSKNLLFWNAKYAHVPKYLSIFLFCNFKKILKDPNISKVFKKCPAFC